VCFPCPLYSPYSSITKYAHEHHVDGPRRLVGTGVLWDVSTLSTQVPPPGLYGVPSLSLTWRAAPGSQGGAEEIKRHPFFDAINFSLIRNCAPPFSPLDVAKPAPARPASSGKTRPPSVPEESGDMFEMEA
jgi:hypothetical protein